MLVYWKKPGENSKIDIMTINLSTSKYFLVAMNENLNHLPAVEDRQLM